MEPAAASPKPQAQLYDAVCAVCGKKTQVPFAPDPARPVFCKEHIGFAGQYKQQMKPRSGEFAPRQPERAPRPRMEQPFKKPENLQALREALKKSLEAQKNKPEPD